MEPITEIERNRGRDEKLNCSGEGSPEVREYLSKVFDDDSSLLIYLKGRKYNVDYAWETVWENNELPNTTDITFTLKRNAEVRFNEYPEAFPDKMPKPIFPLIASRELGILKVRDKFGRRIFYFNMGKWEPSELSCLQLYGAGTHLTDQLLLDEDVVNNGIILIYNCVEIGMKHVREFTLQEMQRQINIFYYAYPVKIKGLYCLNTPFYARCLYKIIRPFLPKKLKERLIISTADQLFEILHGNITPKLLPKILGGILENDDAFDMTLLQRIK